MTPPRPRWRLTPWRVAAALVCAAVGSGAFVYPGFVAARAVFDPALNAPGLPALARRLHESLAPRYARWAAARVAGGQAAHLSLADIAGTEWPLYGSVFYLRAEEAVQAAWERDHTLFAEEPRAYARPAIDAAARLVADPAHAAWVRRYWGESYLENENVFYRMLLISALASHRRLTGSDEFLPLLRGQTDSLAAELAASPCGLLDDYPGQCYPTDIVSAWEAIRRADAVLGSDHAAQIAQGLRAFAETRAGALGLPPYRALSRSGQPLDRSRGCSNSNACMLAPSLWPDAARAWYASYEKHFWQRDWLAAGFREFPRDQDRGEWYFDVDAGPVVRGNGFAACAFGVAAARANGRFDHAYPLSLEMIALSWPLPGGRLALPRMVSDSQNAPYLGEVAILFQLTQQPAGGAAVRPHAGAVPAVVWLCLGFYLGIGALFLFQALRFVRPKKVSPLQNDHGTRPQRKKAHGSPGGSGFVPDH